MVKKYRWLALSFFICLVFLIVFEILEKNEIAVGLKDERSIGEILDSTEDPKEREKIWKKLLKDMEELTPK